MITPMMIHMAVEEQRAAAKELLGPEQRPDDLDPDILTEYLWTHTEAAARKAERGDQYAAKENVIKAIALLYDGLLLGVYD